ncbi:MAG: helix-turn-helix transcriptional regulator [Saonia sp.]
MARACGKDRQALEKLENGKVNPTIYSLLEISEALDVFLSELVNFKWCFAKIFFWTGNNSNLGELYYFDDATDCLF